MSNVPADKPKFTRVERTAPAFAEAPASFNFPVWMPTKDGPAVQLGLTLRANSGPEAVEALIEAITYAQARIPGFSLHRPEDPPSPAAARAQQQPQAPAAAPAAPPPPARPQIPLPAPEMERFPSAPGSPAAARQNPAETATSPDAPSTIYATRLEVTPKPGEKVVLSWFAGSHRFADITKTTSIERAVELLQSCGESWVSADMLRAGSYSVHHAITWVPGKVNASGTGRFKDITNLKVY